MNKTDHPYYTTWKGMRDRCRRTTHSTYDHYGGRGITVCARWDDFWLFVADMGDRPLGYTLDRIDSDGDYTPENCRWSSKATQAQCQRTSGTPYLDHKNHSPMRMLYRLPSGSWRVSKNLNGVYYQRSFKSLDDAKDFRSTLEMECEMMRRLQS